VTDRSIKNTEILKKSVKVKRIAYIFNHSYFLGGGEISLFELLKNLDRASFHPIAIIPKNGQIENKLKAHNINFNISPIPSIKYIFNHLMRKFKTEVKISKDTRIPNRIE